MRHDYFLGDGWLVVACGCGIPSLCKYGPNRRNSGDQGRERAWARGRGGSRPRGSYRGRRASSRGESYDDGLDGEYPDGYGREVYDLSGGRYSDGYPEQDDDPSQRGSRSYGGRGRGRSSQVTLTDVEYGMQERLLETEELIEQVIDRNLVESAGNSIAKLIAPSRPRGTRLPGGYLDVTDFEHVAGLACSMHALNEVDPSEIDELYWLTVLACRLELRIVGRTLALSLVI